MTRLINVRVQIPDALVVHNAEPLTPEHDDSFLIEGITVPAWSPAAVFGPLQEVSAAPSEMLRIQVNGDVVFSWPLELLLLQYRRAATGSLPDAFDSVQDCLQLIMGRLARRLDALDEAADQGLNPALHTEVDAAAQLLRAYTFAATEYLQAPGIVIDAPIPVPPRSEVLVTATKGAPIMAYLLGKRSTEVR